jgi:hypothetical protein
MPMSVTVQAAEHRTRAPKATLRALLRRLRMAVEAHARYRVNSAVPPSQLQQADREIRRYRRMLRPGD